MAADTNSILEQILRVDWSSNDYLGAVEAELRDLNTNLKGLSQATAHDRVDSDRTRYNRSTRSTSRSFRDNDDTWDPFRNSGYGSRSTNSRFRRRGNPLDQFTDAFEKELLDSLGFSDFKGKVSKSLADLANQMGTDVYGLGDEFSKYLGREIGDKLKNTGFGKNMSDLGKAQSSFTDSITNLFDSVTDKMQKGQKVSFEGGFQDLMSGFQRGLDPTKMAEAGEGLTEVAEGASSLAPELLGVGEAAGGMAMAAASVIPQLALVAIATEVATRELEYIASEMERTKGKFENLGKSIMASWDREKNSNKRRDELQRKRLEADVNAMTELSFNVIEDAVNHMMQVWDESLSTITATQGYSKENLQDLIGAFAERIRNEGLASVVSAADITANLTRVLESGLSGKVAEEFAYMATKLNAAIPTEDFFSYASTYASIAANALQQGASQEDAIAYANQELEQFASNLLYSSRELAGGFSTGLTNASRLLEDASKIAVSSKYGDVSDISGILTSVSAIVGAVAPDLADSLVNSVVSAATGGNSDTLIALRSLSGTGASNTAFLNALAANPKQVFSTLFANLAELQNMNSDNFMEVGESLSEVFGLDMGAFSRVDFAYLSEQINAMNLNNASLSENMALLQEGQTTSTAEQLRMQEINEQMIEQGLAYVLDNEAARAIQQNMWEEQRAQALMENEYAVNLKGDALDALRSIGYLVDSIKTFLLPWTVTKKSFDSFKTAIEATKIDSRIADMLEEGRIGHGNALSLYNLTTRGADLNLTGDYLDLMRGTSKNRSGLNLLQKLSGALVGAIGGSLGATAGLLTGGLEGGKSGWESGWAAGMKTGVGRAGLAALGAQIAASQQPIDYSGGVSSSYTWGSIGKSVSGAINATPYTGGTAYTAIPLSANEAMAAATSNRIDEFLGSMQSFVDEGKSYEDWVAAAKEYGITDVKDAFAEAGIDEIDAKGTFAQMEAVQAAQMQLERYAKEEQFWDDSIKWYEETWPLDEETTWAYFDDIITHQDTLIELSNEQIKQLIVANAQLKDFYDQWIDYYVNHTAYSRETLNAYDISAIRNAERSETGDAVLALADALTSNMVDLKDPEVQQNAILAKILIVTEAIMQQVNNTSTVSLPSALSALGLGVTSETSPNITRA